MEREQGVAAVHGGKVFSPVGVLEGRELVFAVAFPDGESLDIRELENVEHELLHLDAVWPLGLDEVARRGVDERDLFLGDVMHEFFLVLRYHPVEEVAREVVDADAGGGVGKGPVTVPFLGRRGRDLGVFDDLQSKLIGHFCGKR